MNPRILTLIGSIGGGCGLTSLIYWKTNNSESTKSQSSSSTLPSNTAVPSRANTEEQIPLSAPKDINVGNCKVIKHLVPDLFFDLRQEGNTYFTISCKDTTSQGSIEKIKKDWIGLFPNTLLLTNKGALTEGKRLNIHTQTSLLGSEKNYRTIFTGDRLASSSVTGEWKNEPQSIENKYVITVSVSGGLSNSHPIFLVFNDSNPFND